MACADAPAAKQQWYHALNWWCVANERVHAVQEQYAAYCDAMQQRTSLPYCTLADAAAAVASVAGGATGTASAPRAAPSQDKRGWKRWGASKMATLRRRKGPADADAAQAAKQAGGSSGPPLDGKHTMLAGACIAAVRTG